MDTASLSDYTEAVLRRAAVACFHNAESHYGSAKLLVEHGRDAHAVALAIIGIEEFAKALVYAIAALRPDQRKSLPPKIDGYHVKIWIAGCAEGAQINTEEWASGLRLESGVAPSIDEWFCKMMLALAEPGLAKLLAREADLREVARKIESQWPHPLTAPSQKEAALYVDLRPDGQLLTPARVQRHAGTNIRDLEWYLEYFRPLPEIVTDEKHWSTFAADVRRRLYG